MKPLRTILIILGLAVLIVLNFSLVSASGPTAPEITQLAPDTYSTSVTVRWTAATSSAGIYQYFLQQSPDPYFESNVTTTTVNGNILSYTYNGLSYNIWNYFRVYAKSNDGYPANMDPYDPETNPSGVRWSAITRTECLPLPATNYSLPALNTISDSVVYSQDGFCYTANRNPTVSWTTPANWPAASAFTFTKLATNFVAHNSTALKSDGTVWAWGYNGMGQLGDGSSNERHFLGQVRLTDGTPLTNITALSSGQMHTMALKNDGTVWTWGFNGVGQLGDGTITNKKNPVQVKLAGGTALTNISAIAGGGWYSISLKNDGTVWGWGQNNYGQLGNGTLTDQNNPVQAKLASGTALTNVIAIAGGYDFTIALKNDGTVWTWGRNNFGQLGNGTLTNQKNPVQVKLASGTALTNIIAVAGGTGHSIALKSDGTVWTWGSNLKGNLGDGTTTDQKNPIQVKLAGGAALTNIIAIAGADCDTIALRNDGTVWTWGLNNSGQLGDGTATDQKNPVQVKTGDGTALTNVSAITGGANYAMALKNNGTIWAWGSDTWGELGDGATAYGRYYAMKIINPISNQIRITPYHDQPHSYNVYPPIYFAAGATSVQTNWNLPEGKYIIHVGVAVGDSVAWSPGKPLSIVTLPAASRVGMITCQSNIINGTPQYQTTIIVDPEYNVYGYKFYRRKNGGAAVCLTPSAVADNIFTDTNLSAHDGYYEYGYTTCHESGLESAICWGDSRTNVSPSQNKPAVYVPNITPNPTVSGPRSIVVNTNVSFNLSNAKDLENDPLEYRLYLRNKGASTWALNQTWTPTTNNQTKTISLADRNNYEWYLTCIETDPNIIDKQEVTIIPCSSLYIDIHYPLPLCSNDFDKEIYDNMWGTKGQLLTFRVECNPLANFQTFVWNFGDGTPVQSGLQTTHIYNSLSVPANPYQILVTATDDQNIQYQGTASIKIINTPKGRLYANETWTVSQTIQADVTVPAGIKLTVDPNTQIKVYPDAALLISGELVAGNGANFDWANGALWKGIRFNATGKGTINGATISHALRGVAATGSGQVTLQNATLSSNNTGVHCYSGAISILGCNILDNSVYGIKEDNNSQPLLQNCIFRGNGIPYYDPELYDISISQLNVAPNTGNQFQ